VCVAEKTAGWLARSGDRSEDVIHRVVDTRRHQSTDDDDELCKSLQFTAAVPASVFCGGSVHALSISNYLLKLTIDLF